MNPAFIKSSGQGLLAVFISSFWFFAGPLALADERKGRDAKPFIFNSSLTNGKKAASLTLGATTFEEAAAMYPAPPFAEYDGGLRPVAGTSLEGHPAIMYVYNPWQTMYALFFDGQLRLVMISELHELGTITEKELLKKHPGLVETDSSGSSIEYQAEVQECVSLIATVETKGRSVEQLSYAYTCE